LFAKKISAITFATVEIGCPGSPEGFLNGVDSSAV
jgi:hypothetical protein